MQDSPRTLFHRISDPLFETSSDSQSQNAQSAGKCVGYRHHDGRHDGRDYRYLFTYTSSRSAICEVIAPPLTMAQ
jgi:hypothetical protein